MLKGNKVIGLIPARAGSQRVPNKNILTIAGQPLISWTIQEALLSEYLDEIVVSTDSEDIKDVAIKYGASVPFMRPSSLSGNLASTDEVLLHAIGALGLQPDDYVVLLQPTSPLRLAIDIDSAVRSLTDESVEGSVSVCKCEHSPLWANTLPEDQNMSCFIKEVDSTSRSQDLPEYFRLNGAVYAYKASFLIQNKKRAYTNKVKASIMPTERSIDIDEQFDFDIAEVLLKKRDQIDKVD